MKTAAGERPQPLRSVQMVSSQSVDWLPNAGIQILRSPSLTQNKIFFLLLQYIRMVLNPVDDRSDCKITSHGS